MNILFELSGEHPSLPLAEAKACMAAYGLNFGEIKKNSIFIVDVETNMDKIREIAGRLALSYTVNEVIAQGTVTEVEEKISKIDFGVGKSFGISGRRFGDGTSISLLKNNIGGVIKREKKLNVDLENPDIEITIFADKEIYLCKKIASINRKKFEGRRSQYRPFSPPISIHPRIAMALVNLSGIKRGETLLDPFCGTGGILIEAGLIGAKVVGIDIKKNIIEGCRKNLEHYGIESYTLYNADATEIAINNVDAIVSDLPYGRSTYIGDDIDKLYEKAFIKMKNWLKQGGIAVVGVPHKKFIDVGNKYLHLEEIHPMRIHRSLTRYFCVYRNII
ncbi:MAG: methyltransferase domain-containing protein [Candidatus Thermoplasmatota archaeon]|nr:methyltransferase domain-containing protein [Candidatus Thermoplasmatota archaeon]